MSDIQEQIDRDRILVRDDFSYRLIANALTESTDTIERLRDALEEISKVSLHNMTGDIARKALSGDDDK